MSSRKASGFRLTNAVVRASVIGGVTRGVIVIKQTARLGARRTLVEDMIHYTYTYSIKPKKKCSVLKLNLIVNPISQ